MTGEEAIAYYIDNNERIISVAKDENRYNYETQQIKDVFMRRSYEANELAIEALEELKAHREAWENVLDEMMNVSIPGQDAEYVYQNIYDIIKKYRPKEGDTK